MAITTDEYINFEQAYNFFNKTLFKNKLPSCLITLQRKSGTDGYYSAHRFKNRMDQAYTDEIALNPDHFGTRSDEEILSVLVHQMVHQYQRLYGDPGRGRYHNSEWAGFMIERGLIPVSIGPKKEQTGDKVSPYIKPDGKLKKGQTGDKVSHFINPGGKFQIACRELLAEGLKLNWSSVSKKKSSATKNGIIENGSPNNDRKKFTCLKCGQNAWAKPSARLICGDCFEKPKDAEYMISTTEIVLSEEEILL